MTFGDDAFTNLYAGVMYIGVVMLAIFVDWWKGR